MKNRTYHDVLGDRGDMGGGHGGGGKLRRWLRRWFLFNAMLSGVFALLWLLLRSGNKPNRFAYPCQQAAFGTATAAFGAPLVATILSARRGLAAAFATRWGRLVASCGLVATLAFGAWALSPGTSAYKPGPRPRGREDYRAGVFVMDEAGGPKGQHFQGMDDLIVWMGLHGLTWYASETTEGFESGPDGLIGADDVVLIKVNAQWSQRGGTNTDVLRGVIARIVDHVDGFVGEIIVADNGQGSGNLDRTESNAEDHGQSAQDVVDDFAVEGWDVSTKLWDPMRYTAVGEYSAGDMADGYIVNPYYDPETNIKVSYPKFQSNSGTYVSYKHGIWSPETETYDWDKLVVINIPVFKTHATYAITASVKNHMGVVTKHLGTDSHSGIGRGGLGSVLAEVRMPDLTILDCIWILARPGSGPSAPYGNASRRDQLVTSLDPIALDMWATKHIMIPQIIENGYTEDQYYDQDPDNPAGDFRVYLDNSMDEIILGGVDVTNDLDRIDAYSWNGDFGTVGDVNGDGEINGVDIDPFVGVILGSMADPYAMLRCDMDGDRDVDAVDAALFVSALVGG